MQTFDAHQLFSVASALPEAERIQLIRRLLLSLEAEGTTDEVSVRDAWLTEAVRRGEEMERGEVKPVPRADAEAAIDALFSRQR